MKRLLSFFFALLIVATLIPFGSIEANALVMDENFTKYKIVFDAGAGSGGSNSSSYQPKETSVTLPSASACGFSHSDKNYSFAGWNIGGRSYGAGDTYTFSESTASRNSENQFTVYATAKWSRTGSSSGSSSGSSGSSSSSPSTGDTITITYTPGAAKGSSVPRNYKKGEAFALAGNPFKYEGYTFEGWLISGYESYGVLSAGTQISVSESVTAVAQWKKKNTGITIIDPDDPSSSSSSSSKPSSSASSSKPASSASSSKPTSSKPASSASSKPSSSSSSVSESSSSSSSISESSSSSSSIPETPVIETFEPISLAYSINGDIPVTGIEYLLKEDIGENPQLKLAALDGYSVTDPAAAGFISSGDALAAFELSLVANGVAHNGPAEGTVTFNLNGTQATAESDYKSYVLAMVHTTSINGYTGEYYMTDGENVYLYNPETAFKNAVANIALVAEEGYNRLVIRDISGLGRFAYQADANTIVEVALISNSSAASASIDVSSLSPVLLVQIEVGEGKAAASGIPFWVWIIIAVIVLLLVALVVLYLINRKNEEKRSAARRERESSRKSSYSSGITGFDDEE